jgi:hypothetical protein
VEVTIRRATTCRPDARIALRGDRAGEPRASPRPDCLARLAKRHGARSPCGVSRGLASWPHPDLHADCPEPSVAS